MKILEVKNLKKHFFSKKKIFKAVDDVSFFIKKSETLALVGESGSGKTTLGKTILRLLNPTDGKVYFENEDIFSLPKKSFQSYRKKMQIIFQDPYSSLNPRMTVKEIIEEPLIIHKVSKKNVASDLLDLVRMSKSSLKKFPHEFSGGQRQRIGIARAIALNPKFLVLDEPISSLDVSIQAQIINLLKELQKELKLTYLFIAHDLAVVKYMADVIAVMYKGKIVEIAKKENLFSNPQKEYTKKLLKAAHHLEFFYNS